MNCGNHCWEIKFLEFYSPVAQLVPACPSIEWLAGSKRLMMKCFVYVLQSLKDNTFYIGLSADPKRRLNEHNSGYSKFTKNRRPYRLLLQEEYASRIETRQREKYLKTGHGRQDLHNLFPCSSAGRASGC